MEFVFVRGGVFEMGSDSELSLVDERPVHRVRVDDFFMSVTEVTNAQYYEFLKASSYEPVAGIVENHVVLDTSGKVHIYPEALGNSLEYIKAFKTGEIIETRAEFPVVSFTVQDMAAFCTWIGGRLPTEAEWEFAARERGKSIDYDDYIQSSLASSKHGSEWRYHTGFRSVKTRPPNSLGLYDMLGNVWEVCSDWHSAEYYRKCFEFGTVHNPGGPSRSEATRPKGDPWARARVIRGGSFHHGMRETTTTYRNWISDGQGYGDVGFRVVLDGDINKRIRENNRRESGEKK